MTIQQLQYAITIAEMGSMNKASEVLASTLIDDNTKEQKQNS